MKMRGHVNYHNLGLPLLLLMTSLVTIQARSVKHRPSSVVAGFVYCVTKTSHPISGATISMECNNGAFKAVIKTNKRGKFKLPLRSATTIKECQLNLLKSKHPHCATSSISHVINHVTFEPRKLQPGITRSNGLGSQKNLLEPITNGPLLGPILQPIVPQLPPLLGMPSTPSFGFPGGAPSLPGLTPSLPTLPIPFPPQLPNSAQHGSP